MRFSRFLALLLSVSILSAPLAHSAPSGGDPEDPKWAQLKGQIAGDLTQAGITFAAGLTGSVPLALIAGILGKYISSYGIQGIKNLIDSIKGYPPQDLGEVNLAYMYLIHVKRNLYSTLISMRTNAETGIKDEALVQELDALQKEVTTLCAGGNCAPTTVDEKLVNYGFLQVALDAKESININQWLSINEMKNTYHYLLLLYLDVIMTEQQLIQTQNLVVGTQIKDTLAVLEKNPYISAAEKEYQAQLALNIGLRWQRILDQRRVLMDTVLAKPLADLEKENASIEAELEKAKQKQKGLKKSSPEDDGEENQKEKL